MSDIIKFFQRGTKKRDLTNKSETGEDPWKIREGNLDCSQISQTSDIPEDVFTESFNSADCLNVSRIWNVSSKETKASQIKGEKQLSDLTDSVQVISDRFGEYEKDSKAKDELITKLQAQVTELTDKVSNVSVQVDEQEQYSRQYYLLIHGAEENGNEDIDTLLISIINEHLGLHIQPSDIDQMYCISNKNKAQKKGREITIKFTKYNIRKKFS